MNRSTLVSLASIFVGVVSFPLTASAQPAPTSDVTADELRSQYIARGYQPETPVTWWTSNHVTTFRVSDATSDRALMVLVYPDSATADAERSRAEARDPNNEGQGPHMVAGYGYSTWRGNVALVESTTEELAREYSLEQDAGNQVMTGLSAAAEASTPMPTSAVDLDLIDVVDRAAVNL
ncbi:MAG TPA: hypothetical protein VGJ60_21225 [Chloroflexota bacterium]|jgi:hypothetical protein